MSGAAKRALGITIGLVVVCAAIGLYIGLYLINVPGSVAATQTAVGRRSCTSRRWPTAEQSDPHHTWVSYYAVDANSGNWRHDTTYVLPANTLVHVTIYQFDTATGLRNPFFSQADRDGRRHDAARRQADRRRSIPTTPSHTFAIPADRPVGAAPGRLRATPRTRAARRPAR